MTIKPYPQNAKKHPDKQLKQIAASIERFGFKQPIVVDSDGTIIVGHGRYEAATGILKWTELKEAPDAKKGEKFIPYIIADDLTEDEIKAYRLADNKLNESEWDYSILDMELELLSAELQELAGFEAMDISNLSEEFVLSSGDKPPFQQITFTLADGQAVAIKSAITQAKKGEDYKYIETMGNENSNGNALYLIIKQWAELRK